MKANYTDYSTLRQTVKSYVRNNKSMLSRNDGILYFASEQGAYPDMMQIDPVIKPYEKITFNVLWKYARSFKAGLLPTYSMLMRMINIGSSATLANALTALRITRWITMVERIKPNQPGKEGGKVFTIHGEPLLVQEVLQLDPDYKDFLLSIIHNHRDKRIRKLAKTMLSQVQYIEDEDNEGRQGLDYVAPLEKMESNKRGEKIAEFIFQSEQYHEKESADEEADFIEEQKEQLIHHSWHCGYFYLRMAVDDKESNNQHKGEQKPDKKRESKQGPRNEEALLSGKRQSKQGLKIKEALLSGEQKAENAENHENNVQNWSKNNHIQNEKGFLGRPLQQLKTSSSSYINNINKEKTTTNDSRSESKKTDTKLSTGRNTGYPASLIIEPYVKKYLSDAEIEKALLIITRLDESDRQDVLDEWQESMHCRSGGPNPMNNPVAYLSSVVRQFYNEDFFYLSGYYLKVQERRKKQKQLEERKKKFEENASTMVDVEINGVKQSIPKHLARMLAKVKKASKKKQR